MTVLDDAAVAMNEMFSSLIRAGFTEPQALYILGVWAAKTSDGGTTDD